MRKQLQLHIPEWKLFHVDPNFTEMYCQRSYQEPGSLVQMLVWRHSASMSSSIWALRTIWWFITLFVLILSSHRTNAFATAFCSIAQNWHHYSDATMSLMASQITGVSIFILNRLFRRRSKKTSKLGVIGLFRGEFTGDHWIPRIKGQWRGKCFHLMTPSCDAGYWSSRWCKTAMYQSKHTVIPLQIQLCLGLYLLCWWTSYRKISWSLEAARFGFTLFQSLWHLTGTSAAALPRCLSNVRAITPL